MDDNDSADLGNVSRTPQHMLFINDSADLGNYSQTPQHMLFIVQEYTNQTFWFSPSTVIALVISYCVVIVVGLVGNILVIVVIFRKRGLRTSRNIYILNLSVCDVIMCSVCMPFSLVKLTLKKWTMGSVMCRIVPALATIDVFVSTLTIVVIALDRYLSIVHTSQLTTRHVVSALVIIWTLSILLSTPLFCFHKIDTQEMYEHTFIQQCIDHWPDELFREVYTTAVMLIQYLTPASFISCLHAKICKFLHYRLEERPGSDTQIQARAKNDLKRHRRNMALLTAMALVFSVTWLPLTLLNITADLFHEVFQEGQYNLLHAISLLLAMSSSMANPIMYGWYNSNFRKALCELLGFPDAFSGKGSSNERSQKKTSKGLNRNNTSSKSNSFNHERKLPGQGFETISPSNRTAKSRHSFHEVGSSKSDDVIGPAQRSSRRCSSLHEIKRRRPNSFSSGSPRLSSADLKMSSPEYNNEGSRGAYFELTERDSLLHSGELALHKPTDDCLNSQRNGHHNPRESVPASPYFDDVSTCGTHRLNVVVEMSPEAMLCYRTDGGRSKAPDATEGLEGDQRRSSYLSILRE